MTIGNQGASRVASMGATVAVLLVLSGPLRAVRARITPEVLPSDAMTISLPGIPGPYCMYGIEKRLRALPAVAGVDLLWRADKIRVLRVPGATLTAADLRQAVERAQYPYPYTIEP